jgi:hypothetical protein
MTDRNELVRRAFAQGLRHNGKVVLDRDGRPTTSAKRVMISIITQEHVYADFAMGLAAMCATGAAEIAICNNKLEADSGVPEIARNNSVETARQLGVDYVLFLAPDIVPTPTTLKKLLEHDLPIVGAVYPRSQQPYNVKGRTAGGAELALEDRLQEMEAMPMGCVLVRMDVFDKLERPYFRQEYIKEDAATERQAGIVPDWVTFATRARQAGILLHADLEVSGEIAHDGSNQCMITRAPASANDGAPIGVPLQSHEPAVESAPE